MVTNIEAQQIEAHLYIESGSRLMVLINIRDGMKDGAHDHNVGLRVPR